MVEGTFFRNISGGPIGEIPELGLGEFHLPPGGLLYVADRTVAQRMTAQTTLYQTVDYPTVLKVLQRGNAAIIGWTGTVDDLEAAVKAKAKSH